MNTSNQSNYKENIHAGIDETDFKRKFNYTKSVKFENYESGTKQYKEY